MATYCTQCGLDNKPVVAVGTDEDDEPACGMHAKKFVERTEAKKVEFCHCGRERGHRGRHRGTQSQHLPKTFVPPPIIKPAAKIKPSVKQRQDSDEEPDDDKLFLCDSCWVVPMACGKIALMYQGDTLKLLQSKYDLDFVMSLVHAVQRRGVFPSPLHQKTEKTGKTLSVDVDEGFIEDMLSMMEPKEKAEMLSRFWGTKT